MCLNIVLDQGWSSSYTVLLTLPAQVWAMIPYIAKHEGRCFLCFLLYRWNKMLFNVKHPPQFTLPFCKSTIWRQVNSTDSQVTVTASTDMGKSVLPLHSAVSPFVGECLCSMVTVPQTAHAEYSHKKMGVQFAEGSSTLLFPKSLAMPHQALSP